MKVWRRHPVLTTGFVLAVVVMLAFAVRFGVQVVYWSTAAHQNQQVQGWMTIGYVAKSWHLEAPRLDALAGLPGPHEKGHPQSLKEIAEDRGDFVDDLADRVDAAALGRRRPDRQGDIDRLGLEAGVLLFAVCD